MFSEATPLNISVELASSEMTDGLRDENLEERRGKSMMISLLG